jgi:hypothetical protein
MIKPYHYVVEGSGNNGQTFKVEGTVATEFHDTLHVAMMNSFEKITKGQAVFGKPGVGCKGPYDVHRIVIEQIKQ